MCHAGRRTAAFSVGHQPSGNGAASFRRRATPSMLVRASNLHPRAGTLARSRTRSSYPKSASACAAWAFRGRSACRCRWSLRSRAVRPGRSRRCTHPSRGGGSSGTCAPAVHPLRAPLVVGFLITETRPGGTARPGTLRSAWSALGRSARVVATARTATQWPLLRRERLPRPRAARRARAP